MSHIHKTGQSVTLPKTPCRWRKGLGLKDSLEKARIWKIFLLSLTPIKTSSLQVVSNTLLKVKLAMASSDFSQGGEPGRIHLLKMNKTPFSGLSITQENQSSVGYSPTKPVTTNGDLWAIAVPLFDLHNVWYIFLIICQHFFLKLGYFI